MTNPPPPGNWGPPPQYGQGQPPYGPGPWPPQQGWGPPQPPKNNSLKWLLISVAVLLVIAISVGATLLFTRDGGGGTTQTANGNPPASGDIASANDTGPVTVITEDPTCAAWRPIATTLSNQQKQGWDKRDYSKPASAWTPEERVLHQSMADAVRDAADQTVDLAKLTPHRVMRELYEQSIAYWRAYADSIPTYIEADNTLVGVASDASSAVVAICAAIENDSASARIPLVKAESPAPLEGPAVNPANPTRFIDANGDSSCEAWTAASNQFDIDAAPWRDNDPNIPASQWTPEQKSTMESMVPVMTKFADALIAIGTSSENATLRDFAALSAQYWHAFALALPTYQASDNSLASAAAYAHYLVFNACASARD